MLMLFAPMYLFLMFLVYTNNMILSTYFRLSELPQVQDRNKMLKEVECYKKQIAMLKEDLAFTTERCAELTQK